MKVRWILLLSLVACGCDAPKTASSTNNTTAAESAPPFAIDASVWGATQATATYEVRELPDGTPGLFTGEGALLLHLLPELVVDAGATGKPRPKPSTHRFELIKLTPGDEGGFTLYARLQDENAQAYDLRIENGPHDPRIHVGVTTKWGRDVTVHRELVRFRTGPLGDATGFAHDDTWTDLGAEWVAPLHAPPAVRWGEQLSVLGRSGTENLAVRQVEDRWEVELEVYHHENHPVRLGEGCGTELDGAGEFVLGSRSELRADFVVGAVMVPSIARFPRGIPAAMALVDSKDGAARAFLDPDPTHAPIKPDIVTRQGLWIGASLDDLPCGNGRFKTLADGGVTAMWSGETMVSSGANLLAPTETDGRRAFAFSHPGIAVPTLFSLSDGEPDAGWLDPAAIAQLRTDRGLVVARSPLETFLSRDASATQTVRSAAAAAANSGDIWLTGVDDVARRLIALQAIDLDVLPEGVVRVRNNGDTDVQGLTLLAPEGATARYPTGTAHQASGRASWFDLRAGGDQLIQFFADDAPFWSMKPADISVSYEPSTKPSTEP